VSELHEGEAYTNRVSMKRPWVLPAAILVVSVPLRPALQSGSPQSDTDAEIKAGAAAFQQGDYARCLDLFREVLIADPHNVRALDVAGICSLELRDYAAAIESFRAALQLQPYDPASLAGIIHAYALAGMTKERDSKREYIHELGRQGRLPDGFNYFDSFDVGDRTVQVLEFPQLAGRFKNRYRFDVFDRERKLVYRVAPDSDDPDQELWAKQHPQQAGAGERRFSLDGYGPNSHATYRFYDVEPRYERLRQEVQEVLLGKMRPQPQSTRGPR
jgi:tetratricopeptide (TPR) repeat protein